MSDKCSWCDGVADCACTDCSEALCENCLRLDIDGRPFCPPCYQKLRDDYRRIVEGLE